LFKKKNALNIPLSSLIFIKLHHTPRSQDVGM
jgi:hypothetical protein